MSETKSSNALKARQIVEPTKSAEDDRNYRLVELPNQLQVLLVSDPTTDKAAASMDVGLGFYSDPDEIPGLAHLVGRVKLHSVCVRILCTCSIADTLILSAWMLGCWPRQNICASQVRLLCFSVLVCNGCCLCPCERECNVRLNLLTSRGGSPTGCAHSLCVISSSFALFHHERNLGLLSHLHFLGAAF